MKVRLQIINDDEAEEEIIIKCKQEDDRIRRIYSRIIRQTEALPDMTFYKDTEEYYFSLKNVLFFETQDENIYAHTEADSFRIKYRLYELELILPEFFVRASKSAIINITKIYSITKNLTSSSLVQFLGSHKKIYVSRLYYKQIKEKLMERSRFEQ